MRTVGVFAWGVGLIEGEGQRIQLTAPAISEEDQLSPVLPRQYRCNACQGVRHKLQAASGKMRKPSEIALTEAYEKTCHWKTFQGYGISMINGRNVLTGPGIETEKDTGNGMGSIQMGGEMWGRRLGGLCTEIVEEVGEMEIFERLKKSGGFCDAFCSVPNLEL